MGNASRGALTVNDVLRQELVAATDTELAEVTGGLTFVMPPIHQPRPPAVESGTVGYLLGAWLAKAFGGFGGY